MTKAKQPSCNDDFEAGAIRVEEAVSRILQKTDTVAGFQRVALRDTLNRVLYRDVISPMNVPAQDNSAMDGYAVSSEVLPGDGHVALALAGSAFAGQPYAGSCPPGQCIRIMTGAMMPEGTDTVVIQEQVDVLDDGRVEIGSGHRQFQNVRFAGEDIKKGAVVLAAGSRIRAAELGVLASLGLNECDVYRKPRVSFFSTGDELRSLGETLGPGEIYDSNRYTLFGLLSRCDVDIIDMGVVRDEPGALREALFQAAACSDVILTSGGVSVGEADFIKDILHEIGEMDFWKILMKPGRPLTSGRIGDALFFGLPGNPVAVMVTFLQFVLPCLTRLSGRDYRPPLGHPATSLGRVRKNPGRREFQRAIAQAADGGGLEVQLTGKQGSGILTSMSRANCFIVLDEAQGAVSEGDSVRVEFFDDYFR
jgi:molybdopterin molybdotransferase